MTGYLTPPPARRTRHRCAPPTRDIGPVCGGEHAMTIPAARIGTVWRCDCGRLWQVAEVPIPTSGQVIARDRGTWLLAGWVTRWRYRHARPIDTPEMTEAVEPSPPPAQPKPATRPGEMSR
jgi:hypothetical protein